MKTNKQIYIYIFFFRNIYVNIYLFFFRFFSQIGYYRILIIVPCAMQ